MAITHLKSRELSAAWVADPVPERPVRTKAAARVEMVQVAEPFPSRRRIPSVRRSDEVAQVNVHRGDDDGHQHQREGVFEEGDEADGGTSTLGESSDDQVGAGTD